MTVRRNVLSVLWLVAFALGGCDRTPTSLPSASAADASIHMSASATSTVCADAAIAPNSVVVDAFRSTACRNFAPGILNAYHVRQAAAGMTVCAVTVPGGWIVTLGGKSTACPSYDGSRYAQNTYVIRPPQAGLFMCSYATQIPGGFVVTEGRHTAVCPHWEIGRANAVLLAMPYSGIQACSASPLPRGWVIAPGGRSSTCPGDATESINFYTFAVPTSGMTVCSVSPIPARWSAIPARSAGCPDMSSSGPPNAFVIKQS
jgi:hypothetical protein